MSERLVRIIFDERVPVGSYSIGGVRVTSPADDEALGREFRVVEVRCHGNQDAVRLRRMVEDTEGLELTI